MFIVALKLTIVDAVFIIQIIFKYIYLSAICCVTGLLSYIFNKY